VSRSRKCYVCKNKLTADDDGALCQACAYVARRAADAASRAAARAKAAAGPPKPRPRKPDPRKPDPKEK
jgi:hypothetical protein